MQNVLIKPFQAVRHLALRGDDLFAIKFDDLGRIHFLKGETKSRNSLSASVLKEASDALQSHDGRPGPHTINYVVSPANRQCARYCPLRRSPAKGHQVLRRSIRDSPHPNSTDSWSILLSRNDN